MSKNKLLFTDNEWDVPTIESTWAVIEKLAKEKYDINYFPAQFELISYDNMLNVYSTHGLPNLYNHWSFGKSYIANESAYLSGRQGLAYEVVINTNPSVCYLMENNTMTMQTLVMAHAAVGHSSFFACNNLFKEHTDPETILGYLAYGKKYIHECEGKYGKKMVEAALDAAHSLQFYSMDRYTKKSVSKKKRMEKVRDKEEIARRSFDYDTNQIQSTSKKFKGGDKPRKSLREENILRFLQQNSPTLTVWQQNILDIVCRVNQYLYPQMQTQVMNEGWASFWHYTLMTDLHDEGYITDGSYLEFIASHTGVVYQPDFDSPHFSGMNVYALGFAMWMDIKRICENPTEEDKEWFPDIAGTPWRETFQEIVEEYRDESFIRQFLSPKVIRDLNLFSIEDEGRWADNYGISNVSDTEGCEQVRYLLAEMYTFANNIPDIYVDHFTLGKKRELILRYRSRNGQKLDRKATSLTLESIKLLWGYKVILRSVNEDDEIVI